jgi:hypothetical protein
MQNKEDENGDFMFDPSQFLTMSQIKSYFSRLTRKQRLHGSQSQSYSVATNNEYDEEEIEEAEKDFDSMLTDIQEQSIISIARQRFSKSQ